MPGIDRRHGMRQGMAAGTVAVLLGLGLAACADPEPASEPAPTSSAAPTGTSAPVAEMTPATTTETAAASAPAAGPTTSAPRPPDAPVTLAFGGDVHFEGPLTNLVRSPEGLSALQPVLG